ncbi:uncharacterized protein LOC114526111 [Dendronephthya gigantea]|uniref:uncharacterized protein LOC114526111 n=1 Tax=Dendronephthya gigantea TaxID=151771 RepID=UPI00106B7D66|nr:uncharacterized protein LOC114526111 [Dendronephthya gigantea]
MANNIPTLDSFFDTGEHETIGYQLDIGKKRITLPNGVPLKFADIIALAGDYYGIPDAPIVNHCKIQEQLDKLLKMIHDEMLCKTAGCHHTDKEWDEATGGIWAGGIPVVPGRMLSLGEKNFDHFQPHAKMAYLAGHEYSIQKAREAGDSSEKEREKLLDMAYSIEAFALHFFTDSFSSGHMRTPRVALPMNITPSLTGDLLCKYMHDEDNKFGLRVTNLRGDKWIAYGDGMLMNTKDEKNFKIAVEAAQASVDQVVKAYKNPDEKIDPSAVTDLLPFVDVSEKNNTPLFQVKDGKLHRRSDINNLQDKKTITNWWGSTTAVNLHWSYLPPNSAI